jgi:CRP-like cAMP-binding protein
VGEDRAAIDPRAASGNRLLRALPPHVLDEFCEHLTRFEMPQAHPIYEPDERIDAVVFPLSGAVSLVAETSEGETADTRLVGRDGFVGLPVFLGTFRMPMRAVCQVPGVGLSMSADDFRSLLDRDRVAELFQYYAQMAMVELSQTILCNRMHNLEKRTARWLLELLDRVDEVDFHLTQEFFATMLGTTRPAITTVASAFRRQGLIDYSRGQVHITNREGLEQTTCECYLIVRTELERLISAEPAYE